MVFFFTMVSLPKRETNINEVCVMKIGKTSGVCVCDSVAPWVDRPVAALPQGLGFESGFRCVCGVHMFSL